MRDEGVTKYECIYRVGSLPDVDSLDELIACRNRLFVRGLVGVYPDGISFGNVSFRPDAAARAFIVTGTQTGHKPKITAADLSLVVDYDIRENRVSCTGPVAASSESLTHAAIYALDARIRAVLHVHSQALWQGALGILPTTEKNVAYGTPAMAYEIRRLFAGIDCARPQVLAMAGHAEGIISFGMNFTEAEAALYSLYPAFKLSTQE